MPLFDNVSGARELVVQPAGAVCRIYEVENYITQNAPDSTRRKGFSVRSGSVSHLKQTQLVRKMAERLEVA